MKVTFWVGFTCRGAAAAVGGAGVLDFAGTAAEVALAFGFTAGMGPVTLCTRITRYGIHQFSYEHGKKNLLKLSQQGELSS